MIWISGSLIWSNTLMELIFNTCGEFRWSVEGTVSQIHYLHLHDGDPWILSDLLRPVQMIEREWGAESKGSYRTDSSLVKLKPWFLSLQWKTCLWVALQRWCLSLQWKICPWGRTIWWWWTTYKRLPFWYSDWQIWLPSKGSQVLFLATPHKFFWK